VAIKFAFLWDMILGRQMIRKATDTSEEFVNFYWTTNVSFQNNADSRM
jgi:hypothetical protein